MGHEGHCRGIWQFWQIHPLRKYNVNDKFYSRRCENIEVTNHFLFYNFTEILSPIKYKYTVETDAIMQNKRFLAKK